jgi:release factor glutamine methyltransferase
VGRASPSHASSSALRAVASCAGAAGASAVGAVEISSCAAGNVARSSSALGGGWRGSVAGMARSVRIFTLPGVFQPRSDARLLATAMRDGALARGARVLEVFTGSGGIAVAAAREGAREVIAVDVSRRALASAWINARRNGARVRVRRGDLFAPVAGERFDLILANPPYVPSAGDALPRGARSRAWEGGTDGRLLLDRLCAEAPAHLAPGGALLIVQSSVCGERATLERLAAAGFDAERVAARRGPLGALMRERAPLLETRGLLAPGQREEELLVLAGRLNGAAACMTRRPRRSAASAGQRRRAASRRSV